MAFLVGGANSASGAYEIDNSLRFNDADTPSLTLDLSGGAGNRKTWTASFWFKLGNMDSSGVSNQRFLSANTSHSDADYGQIGLGSGDYLEFGTGTQIWRRTNRLFRDPSAWYHIVVAMDTTQGTASNRVKIYVNGVQETSFAISNDPTQDADYGIMGAVSHAIGKTEVSSQTDNETFDGYMAEWHFIDGSALAETEFGETNDNGVWIPKAYSGSYGTNGFFLEFQETGTSQNSSGIGADTSGEDNHWAVTNLASTDVTTDTPTNNFATLNPLIPQTRTPTYSEGNLKFDYNQTNSSYHAMGVSTVGLSTGKWYWEVELDAIPGYAQIGILGDQTTHILGNPADDDNYVGYHSRGYAFQHNGGNSYNNNASSSFGGNNTVAGDINNFALDMDNHKLYYGINGTWQNSGDPTSGATGTGALAISNDQSLYFPAVSGEDANWICNFGNPPFAISSGNADANGYGNFEYAVPSGYYALCTKNLAEYG